MRAAIFNRADFEHPADGWYQIEPTGEHTNASAGVIQIIDSEAKQSIVADFNTRAANPRFAGMLVDHEHFKHDATKETRAYGWLMKLQNRDDGIYGQIKWTETGKRAVDGGDYRFFSTEYDRADCEVLNRGPSNKVRPMRLDGLSLTNAPNNKGGTPITNRAGGRSNAAEENPNATKRRAAHQLSEQARAEQISSGVSFGLAFARVMNRNSHLSSLALGKLPVRQTTDSAELAAELMRELAEDGQRSLGGSFSTNWNRVCNRRPKLTRIANRELPFDALSEVEPVAHAAYMKHLQNPSWDFFDNSNNKVRTNFIEAMRNLVTQYPNLGHEGRWEKIQDVDPSLFWKFVTTFTDMPGDIDYTKKPHPHAGH